MKYHIIPTIDSPSIVRINILLRSISKISDLNMVSIIVMSYHVMSCDVMSINCSFYKSS